LPAISDSLASDGDLRRRLPLQDPLPSRRQPGAVCARWRRFLRSPRSWRRSRPSWSRQSARSRSPASCSTRASTPRPPRPGHRAHRRGLQCAEFRSG